jgi:F0F1-type ATP synthase epsilon subunit
VAGDSLHIDLEHNVTLLADSAEHYYEIDIERAEKAKQRAEELLKNHKSLTGREVAFAKNLLEKNLQRISIARKHAHRRRSPITSEGVLEE